MTDLRPTSAQDDLRATLADAGRVDPEVERLRARVAELKSALTIQTERLRIIIERAEKAEDERDKALKGQTND